MFKWSRELNGVAITARLADAFLKLQINPSTPKPKVAKLNLPWERETYLSYSTVNFVRGINPGQYYAENCEISLELNNSWITNAFQLNHVPFMRPCSLASELFEECGAQGSQQTLSWTFKQRPLPLKSSSRLPYLSQRFIPSPKREMFFWTVLVVNARRICSFEAFW